MTLTLMSKKVFGIGMPRTGTTSLCDAFRVLGYKRVAHNPYLYDLLEKVERIDAASDLAVTFSYQILDALYPNAQFVLTVRDPGEWVESMGFLFRAVERGAGFGKHSLESPHYQELCIARIYQTLYGTFRPADTRRLRDAYMKHFYEVKNHFASRPGKLLVLDICRGEGWEKLCPFLRKDIPMRPFPYTTTVGEKGT